MALRNSKGNVRIGAIFALGLAVGLVGCGGEDPLVTKAREKLATTAVSGPDHAEYGATIIAAAPTPQGEEVLATLIMAENNQIVRAAVKPVVDAPPASIQPALRHVFDTGRGLMKLDAGIALAHLGDAEALAWVREEVLARGGGSMTLPAFKLLAGQGDQEALVELVRARMGHEDASIRNEAYMFLGESDQEWAPPLLVEGLGNERGADREQAIVWLATTGHAGSAGAVEKHLRTRGLVFAVLEALGDLGNADSIAKIKPSLESDTSLVRLYAAIAIWKLGDSATALSVLEPMLTDESADLRGNLAQQLAGVDAPEATAMLIQLAEDEDAQIRVDAIRALADRQSADVQALMTKALEDRSYQVQTLALDNLALYGSQEVATAIEPLIENRNPYVAMSAANAMLAIKNRAPAA